MGKENGRILFYSLAGAYLIYLAFSMAKGLGDVTGAERVVIIIAAVVFAVVGVGIVCWEIRKVIKQAKNASMEGPKEEPAQAESKQQAEQLQDEAEKVQPLEEIAEKEQP